MESATVCSGADQRVHSASVPFDVATCSKGTHATTKLNANASASQVLKRPHQPQQVKGAEASKQLAHMRFTPILQRGRPTQPPHLVGVRSPVVVSKETRLGRSMSPPAQRREIRVMPGASIRVVPKMSPPAQSRDLLVSTTRHMSPVSTTRESQTSPQRRFTEAKPAPVLLHGSMPMSSAAWQRRAASPVPSHQTCQPVSGNLNASVRGQVFGGSVRIISTAATKYRTKATGSAVITSSVSTPPGAQRLGDSWRSFETAMPQTRVTQISTPTVAAPNGASVTTTGASVMTTGASVITTGASVVTTGAPSPGIPGMHFDQPEFMGTPLAFRRCSTPILAAGRTSAVSPLPGAASPLAGPHPMRIVTCVQDGNAISTSHDFRAMVACPARAQTPTMRRASPSRAQSPTIVRAGPPSRAQTPSMMRVGQSSIQVMPPTHVPALAGMPGQHGALDVPSELGQVVQQMLLQQQNFLDSVMGEIKAIKFQDGGNGQETVSLPRDNSESFMHRAEEESYRSTETSYLNSSSLRERLKRDEQLGRPRAIKTLALLT